MNSALLKMVWGVAGVILVKWMLSPDEQAVSEKKGGRRRRRLYRRPNSVSVAKRFNVFLANIRVTEEQENNGRHCRGQVVAVLNRHYWGLSNQTTNSRLVGSWGKRTKVRPPRDVDVLFTLPYETYERFSKRTGNIQSQLLQEVKQVLGKTFNSTALKGDGPVVKVPFAKYNIELIPAFLLKNGRYFISMTDGNGHYEVAGYDEEAELIRSSNEQTSGNTRDLIRMAKRWQAHCSVPIKSFWIELLAVDFLKTWSNSGQTALYYDYMVRDFFEFMCGRRNTYVYAPGTGESMFLGERWFSRAQTAFNRAKIACDNESFYPVTAGQEWQKIFGTDIPVHI